MASLGCRNDDLVRILNSEGYQPVALPRTNVEPPEMYTYAGDRLIRRGPLADYLAAGVVVPPLRRGRLDDLQHKQSSSKKVGAAASFLGDALRCIGVTSTPSIDLSFASGHQLTFSFTGVTYISLDSSRIDQMLDGLRTGAIPQEYIDAGQLHIAYDYAYARSLVMTMSGTTSGSASLTALQIDQFINVGGQAEMTVESETTISFRAHRGQPAAFAYKVGRLETAGSRWAFFPEEMMGDGFTADEGGATPCLLERGVVLRAEEAAPTP